MAERQPRTEAVAVLGPDRWSDKYSYAPAVRVGDLLFISGTTGTDESNRIIAPRDIVAQTRQIFVKFDRILRSVGASCANIVQTVDYITTTENYKGTGAIRKEFIGTQATTATGVIVSGLLRDGALIEISAIAVVPRADQ